MADNPREKSRPLSIIINGFNTQNNELFPQRFREAAIIIDGIAPYRWMNPNAPAN